MSPAPGRAGSHAADLPRDGPPAPRLFVTVTCRNGAQLAASRSSDGVDLVLQAPDATSAVAAVWAVSQTQYPTRDGYQPQTHSLEGWWDGFMDPFGIHHYEVSVERVVFTSRGFAWEARIQASAQLL